MSVFRAFIMSIISTICLSNLVSLPQCLIFHLDALFCTDIFFSIRFHKCHMQINIIPIVKCLSFVNFILFIVSFSGNLSSNTSISSLYFLFHVVSIFGPILSFIVNIYSFIKCQLLV